MKTLIAVSIAIIFPGVAFAGIETDRAAGNCAGLQTALQNPQKAAEALGYADNQKRAINFAHAWMDQVKRYEGNHGLVRSMVFSATGDCREIGIRASD